MNLMEGTSLHPLTRTLRNRDGSTELRIDVSYPLAVNGYFASELRYSGALDLTKTVEGEDAFDTLQNVLIMISADLFSLETYGGLHLEWENHAGTGFPNFPGLQLAELPPIRVSELNLLERSTCEPHSETVSGQKGAEDTAQKGGTETS